MYLYIPYVCISGYDRFKRIIVYAHDFLQSLNMCVYMYVFGVHVCVCVGGGVYRPLIPWSLIS